VCVRACLFTSSHLLVNFVGCRLDLFDLSAVHDVIETAVDDVTSVVDDLGVVLREGELLDAVLHVTHHPSEVVTQHLTAVAVVLHLKELK
jgi:hypothetical protein